MLQRRVERVCKLLRLQRVGMRKRKRGRACKSNGIVLQTARAADDAQRKRAAEAIQDAAHEQIRVAVALVDLGAGVAARKAGHAQRIDRQRAGLRLKRGRDVGARTTGAAHGEDALVLGVDVQHPAAAERGHVKALRALHADFLVDSEDCLKPRMGQIITFQKRQSHRYGNAVVAAERSAVCVDKVAVDAELQAVLCKINGAFGRFFRHHVQMSLHDDGGRILIALCRGLDDDDVVEFVLIVLKPVALGKADAVVADSSGVAGTVRDLAEFFKKVEYARGREVFQYSHDASSFPWDACRREALAAAYNQFSFSKSAAPCLHSGQTISGGSVSPS